MADAQTKQAATKLTETQPSKPARTEASRLCLAMTACFNQLAVNRLGLEIDTAVICNDFADIFSQIYRINIQGPHIHQAIRGPKIKININGFKVHKHELQVYLEEIKPSIVLINESKIAPKFSLRLQNYTMAARRDRPNGAGGGTAVFVRRDQNIQFTDISIELALGGESSAILTHINKREVAIVTYYCPNSHDFNKEAFEYYINKYENCLFMGDYNASHLFFGSVKSDPNGDLMFSPWKNTICTT